jgi:hypothetical protein
MVFNATFSNISVISWRFVLLVEETGAPGENHWPVTSHWKTLSYNVVHLALIKFRTHNISGDRIGSCKSNYHTTTVTTAPKKIEAVCYRPRPWSYGSWTYNYLCNHHWYCEVETWSGRGVQHYMIKFFSDLWQVSGFLLVLRLPPPIKRTATI